MGDFFVDDQFYDHPKALHAGEDAADLYVRGLAWAHKMNTPLIPKSMIARLTSRRNYQASARRLCETAPGFDNPLWYDRGDHYEIHDWRVRNAKSIQKREQAKNAAHARWSRRPYQPVDRPATARTFGAETSPNGRTTNPSRLHSELFDSMQDENTKPQVDGLRGDASVSIQHVPDRADSNALPTKEPRNQGTKDGCTSVVDTHAQPYDDPAAAAVEKGVDDPVISSALELLVVRRMLASKVPIVNPAGYRKVTLAALKAEHVETLAELDRSVTWTPQVLADWLEPVPKRPSVAAQDAEEASVVVHQSFHPFGCVCGGQRTDRTCAGVIEEAH